MKVSMRLTSGPALFVAVSAGGPLIGLITGALTARWLTPVEIGAIQTGALLLPYVTFLSFGVYHGLNREFPYLIGRGEHQRALAMVGASWLATKWVTAVTLLIAVGYAAVVTIFSSSVVLSAAVWASVPMVCVYPLSTHYEVLYRTSQDFKRFAWVQAIGYANSLLTLLLVLFFRFPGQCARVVLVAFSNLALRVVWRPENLSQIGNWKDAKSLAGIGFPVLLGGYLYGLFGVADRSVVALVLGVKDVGYYSLTGMVLASMSAFPMAISQIVLPAASRRFGECGSARALRRYVWVLALLGSASLIPIAVIGWLVLPRVVAWFLPNYLPGIGPARIALVAGVVGFPGLIAVFSILRRNGVYIALISICTLSIWVASLIALRSGGGLESVAWIRVAGTAVLSLVSLLYAIWLTK